MQIKAPKGTKDILPSQINKWYYVENTFKEICRRYGFEEMRTPVFEHTELFLRGVGDTTDIVEKQMYTFEDYGKRSITLKPEGTASIVRSFIEHKLYVDTLPAKYFYIIPCFRYEKPQSGRLREFHQMGIEVFGTDKALADAEVISLAMDFFQALGVKELSLRVNSIGCSECRGEYRNILQDFLRDKYDELCDTCKGRFERNPMRILDCKSDQCQRLIVGAPRMLDHICDDCRVDFDKVKNYLDIMNKEYVVDSGIVRGLDYYTKTAFEIVTDTIGAQGTVCGGGRYDNLIAQVGGPDMPGVGFAMGIERLLLVMENTNAELPEGENLDVFIAVMGSDAEKYGLELLQMFRSNGISGQMDLMSRNIKGQFKYADKVKSKFTIVLGDDEITERKASIKDMKTFKQVKADLDNLLETIKELLLGVNKSE